MSNSKIIFNGKDNVLYCEDGVNLSYTTITFNGDNGLVVLGKSKHAYKCALTVNNNCSAVFGRDNYFNGVLNMIASEECTISIGNGCLLSFGIWIRTADPHLIYDVSSHARINPSRDVVIGDHVWIGQSAMVLKGTTIGSGSIVGAMSLVAGKAIPSNTSWGGNPAKCIKEGVFWQGSCVHSWTSKMTSKRRMYNSDEFVFCNDGDSLISKYVLPGHIAAQERLEHYVSLGYDNSKQGRFFIA